MGKRRFVVLMGLDGCGKSTQANLLCQSLNEEWPGISIVHHCSPVFRPTRTVKRVIRTRAIRLMKLVGVHREYRNVGGEEKEVAEEKGRSNSVGGLLGQSIGIYTVTNGFLKAWLHYLRRSRRGLLLDRCFLDDMVKAELRFGGGWKLGTWLFQWIPAPEACFVFRVPLDVSYERKKARNLSFEEYTMKGEFLWKAVDFARTKGWKIHEISIEGLSAEAVSSELQGILAQG